MSELFCRKFAEWIYKTIGEKIDNDFYTAISDRDIELVYILKRDPEWLADRFSELCKKDEPDYNEEIKQMLIKFRICEELKSKVKEMNDVSE